MSDLALYDHTEALKARLATTGYTVGVNQAPPDTAAPYLVLYPLPSPDPDGSLTDPDADWFLQYQVTSVAVGPEQAQGMSDLVRATVVASPLVVAGRSVWRIRLASAGQMGRDDSFQPPLHFLADTLELQTSPA